MAGETIMSLLVALGLDKSALDAGLASAQTDSMKAMGNIGNGMKSAGMKMSLGLTLPIVGAAVGVVNAASDMEESLNKVNVVFADSSPIVKDWASTSATAMGISTQKALEASGTYGNLFLAMGMTESASADMSMSTVQLAADLASFNNASPEDVLLSLRSGLSGEMEPLKKFGVAMTQAALSAKAMEMGLGDDIKALTEAEKIQVRYALITEQTALAQGDFERTSEGLANTTRIVKAQFADAAAVMGQQLLPIALKLATFLSDLAKRFAALTPAQQKTILITLGVVAAIGPLLVIVGSLLSALSTIIPIITTVAGALSGFALPILLIIGLIALLVAAWKTDFGGIQGIVSEFWNGTILPAFEALKAWLAVAIPAALKTLAEFWTNVLLPAINNVWGWIKKNLLPLLGALAEFIATVVVVAIKVLAAYWTNVLWPALQKVWQFVSANIIPLFVAVAELIGTVLGIAITALVGFWQNVLQPALQSMWSWFEEKIMPTIIKVADWLSKKLAPAFDGIGKAIQGVIGWIRTITEKLKTIKLPAWLTPGSPTPFENGLVGIGEAMRDVSRTELPKFSSGLSLVPEISGLDSIGTVPVGQQDPQWQAQKDQAIDYDKLAMVLRDAILVGGG